MRKIFLALFAVILVSAPLQSDAGVCVSRLCDPETSVAFELPTCGNICVPLEAAGECPLVCRSRPCPPGFYCILEAGQAISTSLIACRILPGYEKNPNCETLYYILESAN